MHDSIREEARLLSLRVPALHCSLLQSPLIWAPSIAAPTGLTTLARFGLGLCVCVFFFVVGLPEVTDRPSAIAAAVVLTPAAPRLEREQKA